MEVELRKSLELLKTSSQSFVIAEDVAIRDIRLGDGSIHSSIKADHFGGKNGQITFSAVQVNFPLALEENQKCFHENAVFRQVALPAGNKGGKHFYRDYLLHTSVLRR